MLRYRILEARFYTANVEALTPPAAVGACVNCDDPTALVGRETMIGYFF
jgi:hypothetical protein